ncbi:Urease operon accessory protein [Rhizobium oryziradicis]|uniref:Urease operon accessory protein n=1 Tax=Rhizobium oryziradicis TaxID=1867956 RepID=A0A1Q8ZQN0_9HYPH|nr:Urease operon accessory protein [Rhizobium oryziradicis]OLP44242.1 Urease operon accessory protein [Rhizobium oryziradicis]
MTRTIMIVGNGDIEQRVAQRIDGADMVIRFNGSRNFNRAGSRTDVVAVCNTGRPAKAMVQNEAWRDSVPVKDCRAIWSVRDGQKFQRIKPDVLACFPELIDFFDDYTEAFAEFALSRGKEHVVLPAALHDAVDAELATFQPAPYVVPSSGLMVMAYLLNDPAFVGDEIAFAGFSHQGWDGHPFEAERQLVNAYVSAGRLTRLAA